MNKKLLIKLCILGLVPFLINQNSARAQSTGENLKAQCEQLVQNDRKQSCLNYANQLINFEDGLEITQFDLDQLNIEMNNIDSQITNTVNCPATGGMLNSISCNNLLNDKNSKQLEIDQKNQEIQSLTNDINTLKNQINNILNSQDNFTSDSCLNLSVLKKLDGTNISNPDASDSACAVTAGCRVKYKWKASHPDSNLPPLSWEADRTDPDRCVQSGAFNTGLGDGENAAMSEYADNYCKGKYQMPDEWKPNQTDSDLQQNALLPLTPWINIRTQLEDDGKKRREISPGLGKDNYDQSIAQLENACKNDSLCKWGSGSDKDKKCTGRRGGSVEDELKLQYQIEEARKLCENFNNLEKNYGINIASTTEDIRLAKLERDQQCYRTEGCTMQSSVDHWDITKKQNGEKITPGCTVDISSFTGGRDGSQITEFNAFDAYTGPVFYGPGLRAGARIAKTKLDNTISKERSLQNLILGWMRFALSMTATLAVVALIYAGVLYVTDFGQGSNKEKAQQIIRYVATGIIVILGSYAIVNTLMKARFGNQIDAIAYEQTQQKNSNFYEQI